MITIAYLRVRKFSDTKERTIIFGSQTTSVIECFEIENFSEIFEDDIIFEMCCKVTHFNFKYLHFCSIFSIFEIVTKSTVVTCGYIILKQILLNYYYTMYLNIKGFHWNSKMSCKGGKLYKFIQNLFQNYKYLQNQCICKWRSCKTYKFIICLNLSVVMKTPFNTTK